MPALHDTPMEIDEIMALLAPVRTGPAVVAKAQYSPDPGKAERTLVFTEKGNDWPS